jgi:molybdate transport system substrate-binding protein
MTPPTLPHRSWPAALLGGLLLLAGLPVRAADVSVAVAANFAAPMQKIAARFEQDTGHRAVLAFGSTGRFHAQIRHGAPFEVLLAADAATPARLEQEGLAVAGSRFTYAVGRLVLWSATPGLVDDQGALLRRPGLSRLALADPKLAPYGAAAVETLQKLGLLDAWRPRFIQGESIGQAHQFVASGNAVLGFVALSQVQVDGRIATGSAWRVPAELHSPLRQDAVWLERGRHNPAAQALMRYLRTPGVREIIRAHGYAD